MRFSSKGLALFLVLVLLSFQGFAYADADRFGAQKTVNSAENMKFEYKIDLAGMVSLSKSAGASSRSGLVKSGSYYYYYKSGKKVRSSWRTVKGKRYYFRANGRAATGAFKVKKTYYVFSAKGVLQKASKTVKVVKVGSNRYIVDAKGRAVKGWRVISGKLYYASASGKCAKSKTVDKIPFNSLGYAKPANMRTKLMIKARTIVSKITNDKMTRLEKLRKCMEYAKNIRILMTHFPDKSKKDWQIEWAYHSLDERVGNCYGISCTFSALAKALGENPYLMLPDNPILHSWTIINKKHWDNLGNYQNTDRGFYVYEDYTLLKFW